MKIKNWVAVVSVVIAALAGGYFLNADVSQAKAAPDNTAPAKQAARQRQTLTIDEALAIARQYVETKKLDVSKSHIHAAILDASTAAEREHVWVIKWKPNIPSRGGDMVIRVKSDKSVAASFGR